MEKASSKKSALLSASCVAVELPALLPARPGANVLVSGRAAAGLGAGLGELDGLGGLAGTFLLDRERGGRSVSPNDREAAGGARLGRVQDDGMRAAQGPRLAWRPWLPSWARAARSCSTKPPLGLAARRSAVWRR